MSGMQKPNGPCSNDAKPNGVEGCKPMFIDFNGKEIPMTDDEDVDQPLSQQEIEFATTTTITTAAAGDDEAADTTNDNIVDDGSDAELDADDLQADIGSEKTVDTADIDAEADANVANEDASGTDETNGADNSPSETSNADEPEADGAADNSSNPVDGAELAEPESNGTADNSSNPLDGADGSEVEEPVSNGGTDNNSNPDAAAGTGSEEESAEINVTDDAHDTQTNSNQPDDVSDEGADPDNAIKTDEESNTGVEGVEDSSGVIDNDGNSVSGTDEVLDSDGLGNDESGGAAETGIGASVATNEGKNIDEGESNEASQNTSASTATSDGSSGAEEATQSFYSCSSSSSNGGAKSKPDGAIKVLLQFNYDMTTSNAFNSKTLNALEDSITKDLAGTYNLIACSDKRRLYQKRRYLRKLEVDDNVLALDSKPSDVNIGNVYECMDNDPNSNCTPISGFMTAYLGADSDEEATKAAILQHIQQGMESGDYLTNEIIKTSFIGMSRPARDNSVAAVGLGEQGNGSNQPSFVIGISVFLVAFVALVGLGVLHKKERKKKRQTHASEISRADTARGMEIAVRNSQADNSPDIEADMDKKSHNMASSTLSSSGDEEDLKYGITEDYGDLAATFTYPNLAPRHPESCLAVIDSLDNMEDARSLETGTPKTSPRNATIVAESLLPGMISPASSAEVLEPEALLSSASVDSPAPSTNVSELATPEFEVPNVDSDLSSPESAVDNGDEDEDLLNVDLNATVY